MKKRLLAALLLAALLIPACVSAPSGTPEPSAPSGTPAPDSPTPDDPTPTPTPSPMTPEKLLELEDNAFLASFDYPKYAAGAAGEAYFSGRWFEKEIEGELHHVTVTDGAQIFFMTEGCTTVDLIFTVITRLETPYYAVSIDGAAPKRHEITSGTVTLPDAGRHTVRVVADSMKENEAKWSQEAGIALKAIEPGEGGRMRAIVPQNKVIFFYGDSITEGISVFGANAPRSNSSSTAYPWFTCEKLGAIPYYIGYSGSGVTVVGSFSPFPDAVDHLSRSRKADLEVIPDAIVINHGTNDGAGQSADFRNNLKRALDKIVKYYPGVPVIYMIPFCGNRAEDIATVCADYADITVVPTASWGISYTDGLHPNRTGAKRAGDKLAAKLKSILGSSFFDV